MEFYQLVFETIDMRSFSNLWFWIMLAVIWSSASHWVLGIPYDMVGRAKRHGGQAAADLEALAAINANRLVFIAEEAGVVIVALTSAVLTGCGIVGFQYGNEFAQALFLLGLPLSVVTILSVSTARHVQAKDRQGAALYRRLWRHRVKVQGVGLVSIFVTAVWGMFKNLATPLG